MEAVTPPGSDPVAREPAGSDSVSGEPTASDLVSGETADTSGGEITKRGPAPSSGSRGREWLAKGLFEGTLILIGLLGAFALNEWQDARARSSRTAALMTAIRTELTVNLGRQEDATQYNAELVAQLREMAANGASSIEGAKYPRGLFLRAQLTSAAWTSAQSEGVLDDLPVDKLLSVANAYEAQDQYQQSTSHLYDILYEAALRPTSADNVVAPQMLAGVLSDYTRRGGGLAEYYRNALAQLSGDE